MIYFHLYQYLKIVLNSGHLDRVLHGISGEEVLYACDENTTISSSVDSGLANPAVHFFRGLRHRNISAIKHATQVSLFISVILNLLLIHN